MKATPTPVKPASKPSIQSVRVISITSGKGGVGKSNVVSNLALALSRLGQKTMIWDADLGLANIDVLLGLKPEFNIHHLLTGEKSLREILVEGPGGVKIMPASSGIQELSHLGEGQRMRLLSEFDEYDEPLDFLLIDTGAGISTNVTYFNTAAQELIVVVTPEPTSITDAYAVIKVMSTRFNRKKFHVLLNQVAGPQEAKKVFTLLANVADQHLASSISLGYLGFIPKDEMLIKSVRLQKAVVEAYPSAEASIKFLDLAKKLLRFPPDQGAEGNISFFWKRLFRV